MLKSEVDDISGIGRIRKEKLIKRFGSVKRIREASLEELNEILPANVAEKVYRELRGDGKEESAGNR